MPSLTEALPIADAAAASRQVLDAVDTVVVGKRSTVELVFGGLIAGGHALLEDPPGLGKTLLARALSEAAGLTSGRVQFTPDLMPGDVTGSMLFDRKSSEFVFRPGPVFRNLVIADEINRAPPKTQAALLEAMQERRVTVDGVSHGLPDPFIVLATQNPIEFEGTYPLPEAQIDRFLLRTSLGFPSREDAVEIVNRRLARQVDETALDPVIDLETVLRLRSTLETIEVDASIVEYCVDIVEATQAAPQLQTGVSPRGTDALIKLARSRALLAARGYVTPDDVKSIAEPALAHRLVLRPELWMRDVSAAHVVAEILQSVPAPATLPAESAAR